MCLYIEMGYFSSVHPAYPLYICLLLPYQENIRFHFTQNELDSFLCFKTAPC